MELTNDFRVAVPVDDAWAILNDVERIAPCLPGAQLQEVEGDQFRGIVKVKVGPITAQYKGSASFVEQDPVAHRVVLRAEGRDTRGQGNANATVTATLSADGDGTAVTVVTDLTITGKVAQFGRGVLADVSAKLMGQFVENLERDVLSGPTGAAPTAAPEPAATPSEPPTPGAAQSATESPSGGKAVTATATMGTGIGANGAAKANGSDTIRRIDHRAAEPVDLLATAGSPVAKRVAPLVGAAVALLFIVRWIRRRRA